MGQLVFTIGQQVSTTATYEMADTVAETASDWVSAWSKISAASDTVAEAQIDMSGANVLVLVATDRNRSSVQTLWPLRR